MQRPHSPTPSRDRGRRLRHTIRTLACIGALLALNASTAAARPQSDYGPDAASTGQSPTVVRVVAPPAGFDWGDAGVGAVAGLAISFVALGVAIAASRRHDQRVHATIHPTT